MSTFNRLSVPPDNNPAPASSQTNDSAPSPAGMSDNLGAMFPPLAPASYLADAVGVDLVGLRQDSLTDLTAPEVLCNRCAFGHILKSRAATQNRKADGSPFYFLFGQCLRVTPPMSLDDLRVEHCNQFKPVTQEN